MSYPPQAQPPQPQQEQKPKPRLCKNGCGRWIIWNNPLRRYFDNELLIPHDCPNKPTTQQQYSSIQPQPNINVSTPALNQNGQPIQLPTQGEHFQLEIIAVLNKIHEDLELNNQYLRGLNQNLQSIEDYVKQTEYNTAKILATRANTEIHDQTDSDTSNGV